MTEAEQLKEARELLAWVFYRSRHGCSSFKRSERDAALSDINYWTERFRDYWQPSVTAISRDRIWCGEHP